MTEPRKRWLLPAGIRRWPRRAERRAATAIHEAGHAVIAELLGFGVRNATMGDPPRIRAHVSLHPYRGRRLERISEWIMRDAGSAAERHYMTSRQLEPMGHREFDPDSGPTGPTDTERRVELVHDLPSGPELSGLVEQMHKTTEALVEHWWGEIESVALQLVQLGELSGDEVCAAIDNPAPPGALDEWLWTQDRIEQHEQIREENRRST